LLLLIYREKAERRQKATQLIGKGIQQQDMMVTQNIGEQIGEAIKQFAQAVAGCINPEKDYTPSIYRRAEEGSGCS
jgi:hypothetical protein